jgi:hypothetical protein
MNGYPPDWLQPWLLTIAAILTVAAVGGFAVMIGDTIREMLAGHRLRRAEKSLRRRRR